MKIWLSYAIALGLSAILSLIGWWVAALAPDGASLPVHWTLDGQPDRFAPLNVAFAIPPIGLICAAGFMHFAAYRDARKANSTVSSTLFWCANVAIWVTLSALSIAFFTLSLGYFIPLSALSFTLIGLDMLLIGYGLTRARQSAGRWFLWLGIVIIAFGWVLPARLAMAVIMLGVLGIAIGTTRSPR
ncbi:MAG: hypothetical protein WA782_07585 [Sulfitobacter sp.]